MQLSSVRDLVPRHQQTPHPVALPTAPVWPCLAPPPHRSTLSKRRASDRAREASACAIVTPQQAEARRATGRKASVHPSAASEAAEARRATGRKASVHPSAASEAVEVRHATGRRASVHPSAASEAAQARRSSLRVRADTCGGKVTPSHAQARGDAGRVVWETCLMFCKFKPVTLQTGIVGLPSACPQHTNRILLICLGTKVKTPSPHHSEFETQSRRAEVKERVDKIIHSSTI